MATILAVRGDERKRSGSLLLASMNSMSTMKDSVTGTMSCLTSSLRLSCDPMKSTYRVEMTSKCDTESICTAKRALSRLSVVSTLVMTNS